ncbi:MAG TPA: hypothetical protein VFA07_02300 [Chthonomonadaceae bacterium]|nr:hypothetical protein [Chthonomonadaceae bacterium]
MILRSKTGLALVGAALLILSVGAASAQGRRGGMMFGMMGRGRGGGLMLLDNKSVQEELHMTQPQIDKAQAKSQELREQMRQMFQQGQQGGQPNPEAMRANFQKMQQAQEQAVADILDSRQLHRFRQIELQQMGPGALMRKDVQDALHLTASQRQSIDSIRTDAENQMRNSMQGVDPRNMSQEERQQMRQRFQSMQKATGEKMAAVLTGEQRAHWKQMLGTPFTIVRERGPGGPGGGGD